MKHCLLERLDPTPFNDLCVTDFHGNTYYLCLDAFRRLYNDALESMNCYEQFAETCRLEAEKLRQRCERLEDRLMELSED
jgi:hypothetical protein